MQISHEDRELLCQQFLFGGVWGGAIAVKNLMSNGLSFRDLCLNVVAPVSKRFDDLWREDRASFLDVSIATMRIENILRDLGHPEKIFVKRTHRKAIFASMPRDEHTIGIRMATYLQRSKGWDIQLLRNLSYTNLLLRIEHSSTEILGLSIGSSSEIHSLYNLVRTLRTARPRLKILVSGSLVVREERTFEFLGADGYAASFEEAETILDNFAEQDRVTASLNWK